MKNKKKLVIKWFKEFEDRLSTSKFVGILGIDYHNVKKLLKELEKDEIIKKEKETNATYWILNKEEDSDDEEEQS